MARKLILKNNLSPGDVVAMTAAVRELHHQYPGEFETDVRTPCNEVFENNPHVTKLDEWDTDVTVIGMEYPLINQSNQKPVHFIEAYCRFLAAHTGLPWLEPTEFKPHIYLSNDEKSWISQVEEITGDPTRFWIINAGGKNDFTCKVWPRESFQSVVDHFRGRIQFVQIGAREHNHPALDGVIDLRGKTDHRQLIRLVYHASGVLTGVSYPMHLAAGVPTPEWLNGLRPCVVIGGGREPASWVAYPGHQYLHTIGGLDCCASGACWKSRVHKLNDGENGDTSLCENPSNGHSLCMRMIEPRDVIRAIERYVKIIPAPKKTQKALISFRHGLGDAVQLTAVVRHLRHNRPDWEITVEAGYGKHSAFNGLADHVRIREHDQGIGDTAGFTHVYDLDWHEPNGDFTKVERCLRETFGIEPARDLLRYEIRIGQDCLKAAKEYFREIAGDDFKIGLLHYEGNTGIERKNLSHEQARAICREMRTRGITPVILDWDDRSPVHDQRMIFCPDKRHALWRDRSVGDAEQIAALMKLATVIIAIDSGPQKIAATVETPTIAVWTGHSPVNYFCPADNVTHLVPPGAKTAEFHRTEVYHDLVQSIAKLLPGEPTECPIDNSGMLRQLTTSAYDETYYEEHKVAGLDYLWYGDWQEAYGRWLKNGIQWEGATVLDVGCACGSIVRGMRANGINARGIDLNQHMIALGRQQWPDMGLDVCDAVNLHLFGDGVFDGIHSSQNFEHLKPVLVPFVLQELARVAKPGSLLFCSLDTTELFERQNRSYENDDPTHLCIRPIAWWKEIAAANGWRWVSDEHRERLLSQPEQFIQNHDWDWFVCERV